MQKTLHTIALTLILVAFFLAPVGAKELSDISDIKLLTKFNISKDAEAILLPVEFNGKEYLFELDTRSSHTLFDISLKDMLGKCIKIVRGKTPAGLMEFVEFLSQFNEEENENVTFTVKRGNQIKHESFEKRVLCFHTMELIDTPYRLNFK